MGLRDGCQQDDDDSQRRGPGEKPRKERQPAERLRHGAQERQKRWDPHRLFHVSASPLEPPAAEPPEELLGPMGEHDHTQEHSDDKQRPWIRSRD